MNTHHLEIFYYVATFRGFTAGAQGMPYGIQQPAVSDQIGKLESHLGVKLIRRFPFKLTTPGQILYDRIRPFFDQLAALENRIKAYVPCPRDTDGDGNCGQPACPNCHPEIYDTLN